MIYSTKQALKPYDPDYPNAIVEWRADAEGWATIFTALHAIALQENSNVE